MEGPGAPAAPQELLWGQGPWLPGAPSSSALGSHYSLLNNSCPALPGLSPGAAREGINPWGPQGAKRPHRRALHGHCSPAGWHLRSPCPCWQNLL